MKEISRRNFLWTATSALAASAAGCRTFTGAEGDFDDQLSVFMSDLHINTTIDDGHRHQAAYLMAQVAEIARMRPLPRRVVVFGDIAYFSGHREDYRRAKELLQPLVDAGVQLVLGMGNHDRRSAFLEFWPEYAQSSPIKGRIVSEVDLGSADLVLLDGLAGTDDRSIKDAGPGDGVFDAVQQEWILAKLKSLRRPTFFASHFHPALDKLEVGGRALAQVLRKSPHVAGYIFGHWHRWWPDWEYGGGWKSVAFRTLGLPSTGHWGDIGYATFRLSDQGARADFVQKDFFFHDPPPAGQARQRAWDDVLEEHRGAKCVFRFDNRYPITVKRAR